MTAKEYLSICRASERKRAIEVYKRQQKLRKIKNWIVIFIVAAVFLLFSYGVFGLIVDILPQMVK